MGSGAKGPNSPRVQGGKGTKVQASSRVKHPHGMTYVSQVRIDFRTLVSSGAKGPSSRRVQGEKGAKMQAFTRKGSRVKHPQGFGRRVQREQSVAPLSACHRSRERKPVDA